MRRHAQHQTGRGRREQDQQPLLAPGDRRPRLQGRGLCRCPRSDPATEPGQGAQAGDHHQEQTIAQAPAQALERQTGQGFDQDRIGQQGQKTAQVRSGIEDIGVLCVRLARPRPRIPGLQQGRGGRQDGEGRPDREGQGRQKPGRRGAGIGIAQDTADPQGQRQACGQQKRQMNQHLKPHRPDALQDVGVAVAGQQRGLEEDHGGVPHRRRSAQAGQDQLGRHRLNHEDQTSRGEDGQREQERREPPRVRARRAFGLNHIGHGAG